MINDDVITALFQNLKVRDPSLQRESAWDDYDIYMLSPLLKDTCSDT
jgi:hypothetical protein